MNTNQDVMCPFCRRPQHVRNRGIDASGFQTFRFKCSECGGTVSGIIDPVDNVPLDSGWAIVEGRTLGVIAALLSLR